MLVKNILEASIIEVDQSTDPYIKVNETFDQPRHEYIAMVKLSPSVRIL